MKTLNNKETFGEVKTPISFIEIMISMLPRNIHMNPLQWLDPCAGDGRFLTYIQNIQRHHNSEFSVYEINDDYENTLKSLFSCDNVFIEDFTACSRSKRFDVIIGNPPFNFNGGVKVPTNKTRNKKKDGITIWPLFIHKSIEKLKPNGILCMVVPSIWLKPDRSKLYYTLLEYDILKIRSFTNTESNRIFNKNAQTPISIFVLRNKKTKSNNLTIFDKQKINL